MKVMKFGGTSLANWQRFSSVVSLVANESKSQPVAVVLSAPAGVTNNLVKLIELAGQQQEYKTVLKEVESTYLALINEGQKANALSTLSASQFETHLAKQIDIWTKQLAGISALGACPDAVYAKFVTAGEALSAAVMQLLLTEKTLTAEILAPQKYLLGVGSVLEASVDIDASRQVFAARTEAQPDVWVMPGFTAGDAEGKTLCLGRNGSDYSAAVLAACINADSCEIWTDVDGVYNTDPRVVKDVQLLSGLSYPEAMELSYFGAKVLHPKTILPIAQFQIPCYIKNTFNPSAPGTLISSKEDASGRKVKAISNLDNQTMFDVSGPGMKGMVGMASRVLEAIARIGVSVSLITQSSSEYSISFCVATLDAWRVKRSVEQEFELELKSELLEPIELRHQLAIVSLIGDGMRTHKGVAAGFFQALAQAGINIVALAQGSSERSISAVIAQSKVSKAMGACHQRFFDVQRYLDVFLIGSGNVGAGLLEQISSQDKVLKKEHITVRVCGIANSRNMLLNAQGINLDNWREKLEQSDVSADLGSMLTFAKEQQLLNPVLVDCSASDKVADRYLEVFQAGLHVVTPNKKANTREYDFYERLRQTALKHRRQFLYETTVGAGLPVIDNLKKLLLSGDKLQRFNGILSGSLSYIFGMLEEGMTLSAATANAREKCFTEPDPRDDLSGMDVARKVLILAREVGMKLSLEDIDVQSVLPPEFDTSGDLDTFMTNLADADEWMAKQIASAKKQGKVLRYVGQIDEQGCRVVIAAVDENDPLFTVKGGENALAFYSRYYQPLPFVLRGYGAGTAVTAAGTFADLLRTLNWDREVS